MRTFKRPMFRKGGNVGDGIMTGIVDRTQAAYGYLPGSTAEMKGAGGQTEEGINLAYSQGISDVDIPDTTGNISLNLPENRAVPKYLSEEYTGGISEADLGKPKSVEEYLAQLKEGAGEYGGMDPLTTFLLTAGPRVAGATDFADAVSRLEPAAQQLIKGADARAKYNRDLRRAAVNLGLQEEQRFDDRRFNLLLQADDRNYQRFLTQDERNYLAQVKADDRIWQKDLIKNEREFNLQILKDQRAYDKLKEEDKRAYDEKINERARAYQKFDEKDKRAYEERLIKEGRAFELEKIIKQQEFQMDLYAMENDPAKKLDDTIDVMAIEAVNEGRFEDLDQAKNNVTWRVKKAGDLRKKGYSIGSILSAKNKKNIDKFAKTEGKAGKGGSVYYDDVNDKIYQLSGNKDDGFRFVELDENMSATVDSTPSGDNEEKFTISASEVSLTYPQAQTEAQKRGYQLLPPPPEGASRGWLLAQKRKFPDAITKKELEEIMRKELFAKKYENIKQ